MTLTSDALNTIFGKLPELKFGVIGDFCLDFYMFLDNSASEVSIETGLRTNTVRSISATPGGAGNVAANLTSLGAGSVFGIGVLGNDLFGREYIHILESIGVKTENFVIQPDGWSTCVYTKLYDGENEQPRIDFGNFNDLSSQSGTGLLSRIEDLTATVDLFLVNQQLLRGIHTEAFRTGLREIISRHPSVPFLLDSRDFVNEYGGTVRKLNDREAASAAGLDPDRQDYRHIETVTAVAKTLHQRWRTPVFITRGDRGAVAYDGQCLYQVPGLHLTTPIDTVGAGDSAFAAIAAGIAANLPAPSTLQFASLVAGVTIQKLYQTGSATEEEVRALATRAEFRIAPETAEAASGSLTTFWKETEIEVVNAVPPHEIKYAIFDHDGTISTMRQGWETVMEPVMVRAILGSSEATVSPQARERIVERVREFIDKTTGVQTLVQMAGLAEMVRSYGFVAPEDVLNAEGYKRVYLAELNQVISGRVRKFERGELEVGDLTVKGAVRFLHRLQEKGLRLYLASGTDQEDARREAGLLGYGELFDGGIFGATGSIDAEPKKLVLDMILNRIGPENGRKIVVFGDGPVEIRETWKRGGMCVGVASDEVRRFGLNTEKRRRLILAGASLVVPDFSMGEELLRLLFPGGDDRNENRKSATTDSLR